MVRHFFWDGETGQAIYSFFHGQKIIRVNFSLLAVAVTVQLGKSGSQGLCVWHGKLRATAPDKSVPRHTTAP